MQIKMDFLKKAKKSELMTFTAAVCGVIIVGYYIFFFSPVAAKAAKLFRETAKLQETLDKAEISINSVPKIKNEIEALRSREGSYSNRLPREEEFPAVLESLSRMAQNTGVKITKIQPKRDKKDNGSPEEIYRQQAIIVKALCGYHQLGTFIAELENAERFMDIDNIKIGFRKMYPRRHNAELVVRTFILKDPEEEE